MIRTQQSHTFLNILKGILRFTALEPIYASKECPGQEGTFKINNADGILSFEVSDSYVVNCTGKAC